MVQRCCQVLIRIQAFVQFSNNCLPDWWQEERFLLCFSNLSLLTLYFLWVPLSGFGSSFLPKEESVTAAPEVEVSEDYQASSQVSYFFIYFFIQINIFCDISKNSYFF